MTTWDAAVPKPLALIISGSIAAGAIAALSVFAAERQSGLFDRSALANLSGASLGPATTGSVLPRDDAGAAYRKRVEDLDKDRLGSLARSAGTRGR